MHKTVTWLMKKIGDLCEAGDGTHTTIKRQKSGVLYLTSRNFKDGRLDLTKVYFISEDSFNKHFKISSKAITKPEPNDVVFSIIGTIGEPYLVQENDRFGLSSSVAILRPNHTLVDSQYLYYWIQGPEFQSALYGIKGGVAQSYISLEMIRSLPLRFPPREAQQKIVSILSTYDNLIENNLRRIRILEEMAHLIYREWFVKFRFPGYGKMKMVDSPLGEIPEGWEVVELGEIADLTWGDTTVTKKSYVDEGYDAYSASGLDGKLPYYDFEKDGVVLSAIGAQCGKAWLAKGKWSCIKNTIRYWSTSDRASTEYLYLITARPDYWPKRGSAQPFISQGDARKCRVVISDIATMNRFTVIIQDIFSLGQTLAQKNIKLRQTRDLLLPKLLSGQLDVSELNIDIGESAA